MKTASLDPLKPSRADHRLIRKLLDSSYSGKVVHTEKGYEVILSVFKRAKGSWERLFQGSSKDLSLLKKILKAAVKGGQLQKTEDWR